MKRIFYLFFIFAVIACSKEAEFMRQVQAELEDLNELARSQTIDEWPPLLITKKKVKVDSLYSLALPLLEKGKIEASDTLLLALRNYQTTLSEYLNNPSLYNIGFKITQELKQDKALKEKLASVQNTLTNCPSYYLKAKEKLSDPVVQQYQMAIRKQISTFVLIDGQLRDSLASIDFVKASREDYEADLYACKLAVKDYLAWCQSHLLDLQNKALFQ